MNRPYGNPSLGTSKAGPTTTCQKCLQKDSYECKTSLQSRPYNSRPSRTQQLRNPRLKPALTADKLDTPKDEIRVSVPAPGTTQADSKNAQSMALAETEFEDVKRGKSRSESVSSGTSVSTISTRRSASPQSKSRPKRRFSEDDRSRRYRSRSRSVEHAYRSRPSGHSRSRSHSPTRLTVKHNSNRDRSNSPSNKRRRRESANSGDGVNLKPVSTSPIEKRHIDPERHERKSGPQVQQPVSQPASSHNSDSRASGRGRQRSLSPYSRRLALTQAMNAAR